MIAMTGSGYLVALHDQLEKVVTPTLELLIKRALGYERWGRTVDDVIHHVLKREAEKVEKKIGVHHLPEEKKLRAMLLNHAGRLRRRFGKEAEFNELGVSSRLIVTDAGRWARIDRGRQSHNREVSDWNAIRHGFEKPTEDELYRGSVIEVDDIKARLWLLCFEMPETRAAVASVYAANALELQDAVHKAMVASIFGFTNRQLDKHLSNIDQQIESSRRHFDDVSYWNDLVDRENECPVSMTKHGLQLRQLPWLPVLQSKVSGFVEYMKQEGGSRDDCYVVGRSLCRAMRGFDDVCLMELMRGMAAEAFVAEGVRSSNKASDSRLFTMAHRRELHQYLVCMFNYHYYGNRSEMTNVARTEVEMAAKCCYSIGDSDTLVAELMKNWTFSKR